MSPTEPRTWDHPTSPPGVTRVTDVAGRIWERRDDRWTTPGAGHCHWHVLLHEFGPLTEVPTPALPTEPGTVIRATGSEGGIPFRDVVLIRDLDGYWHGDVAGGYVDLSLSRDRIDTFTVLATYDPALYEVTPKGTAHAWHDPAHSVVVPRKEYDALRDELRSVVASAGADLDPDPYIANAARALIHAVDVERIEDERPDQCCGKCPPIVGGGYDCTCEGNPRCSKEPTTPVPTTALDALRAAFDAPPTPTGTSPARAALDLLHATDALNEGDQL